MPHSLVHRTIAVILLACSATPAIAGGAPIKTDANLATALDVSDSIMRHEEWLEFEGMARAVTSAALLDAIASGQHGRIGFAVFTWSSGGRFELLVPWTLIASITDAEGVATMLRRVPSIDRRDWAGSGGRGEVAPIRADLRTDISATIDFATDLALLAPYRATRSVINICANGKDNVGADPRAARDRAVATGMTVNGLIPGAKHGLAGYFREHVQGGTGSFVIEVSKPEALSGAMTEKLLRDLVAARSRPAPSVPLM
jgi:Ca-activated chloride channel family protein